MHHQDNFDDPTSVTLNSYQQIATNYAQRHAESIAFWHECMQRFVSVLRTNPIYQAQPSLPVMDAGCGPGRDSLFLAQLGFAVLAVDLSDAMLAEARRRCQGQPQAERITFQRMDMRNLTLPDASCAGIWASASFLHIPKRENLTVLQELVRVLIPGGPIMLLVKECDSGDAERFELHEESGTMRFFARYRGSELWALCEQAGLQVLQLVAAVDSRFTDGRRWLGALGTK